ncbi:hypothetical protein GCM10022402_24800 [Salinactinospora qingdaonensis]|uniref:Uncharacterized protein n=1 Tax=Salinactinospora qingdaonensis TaxID=702744 RepID=A0ABP7FTR2_9ACTN
MGHDRPPAAHGPHAPAHDRDAGHTAAAPRQEPTVGSAERKPPSKPGGDSVARSADSSPGTHVVATVFPRFAPHSHGARRQTLGPRRGGRKSYTKCSGALRRNTPLRRVKRHICVIGDPLFALSEIDSSEISYARAHWVIRESSLPSFPCGRQHLAMRLHVQKGYVYFVIAAH